MHFVQKPDGSLVTDLDPLIERIVLEHILDEVGGSPVIVREEAPHGEVRTTGQIAAAEMLVTVDGIDGTGRFICPPCGLWPVLVAAGFRTVDFEDLRQEYEKLDAGWFGDVAEVPGKIRRPLLIAPRPILADLEGAVAWKPGFESGDCGPGSSRSP